MLFYSYFTFKNDSYGYSFIIFHIILLLINLFHSFSTFNKDSNGNCLNMLDE